MTMEGMAPEDILRMEQEAKMGEEMDKEAQEGIAKIFEDYSLELDDSGQGIIENYYYFRELAKRVYWAGYRKLPKDKPPLLSDEKLLEIQVTDKLCDEGDGTFSCNILTPAKIIAQAQREICIKHYEG